MAGNGLTKVGDEFIYVRSNGELVVNKEYYVPANNQGIEEGIYTFDANGYLVIPKPDPVKDGIYFENGAWYYYENGVIGYNKGLVNTLKTWYDADGNAFWGEGGIIYVRSNGQLATGKYYVTNLSNYDQTIAVAVGAPLQFNEYGLMGSVKNGIVDGYYYENNQIVYSAGLIQIDGNYYYVRSNGQVVMGRDYWISNANDTGIKLGCYTFDENGVMQIPETYGFTGIKNGYYYIDGSVAYGAGVVKLDDGTYIYVRSNGQLAVGKYWPTTLNGYLPAGEYDFGEDGILTVE
jgi:glucan-binding YG repeat protein